MSSIGKFFAAILAFLVTIFAFVFPSLFGSKPEPPAPVTTTIAQTAGGGTATTTTTTTTTAPKAPLTVDGITLTQLEGLTCTLYTDVLIESYDSLANKKDYTITGYRLKDVLEALGFDMDSVTATSTLLVADTTDPNNHSFTPLSQALFMSDDSYIALSYTTAKAGECPRLFPAANLAIAGGTYVNNGMCIKAVDTLTLTY